MISNFVVHLKYEFYKKSLRKDEPLTSWTLFEHICHYFWVGLLVLVRVQQQTHPKVITNMLKKVFNWSEVHLSEVTSYKIHTLTVWFCPLSEAIEVTNYENVNTIFVVCLKVQPFGSLTHARHLCALIV